MPDDRAEAATRSRVPFWAHQLAELLLGVVLLFEGARTGTHISVVVAGVVLILFSLMTDGPLSAWPVISRTVHRVGDIVFALVLAASPFLLGIDESIAIVLLEVAALALLWLAWRSDFRTPVKRRWRKAATSTEATAATAADAPPTKAAPANLPSARDAGRALGRLRSGGARAAGRAVGKASAERATEQQASAERATEQQASAERASEQQERDAGDESSPE